MTPETQTMLPLLLVALLIWAGVWGFTLSVDRKVARLEARVREIADCRDAIGTQSEGEAL